MRNVKLDLDLTGRQNWPGLGVVTVPGDPEAAPLAPGLDDVAKEAIIQAWPKVAVLRVVGQAVRLGFIADGHAEYLSTPIEPLDGLIGVHLGPKDTTFVALPSEGATELALVTVTQRDDSQYTDLPVY